MPRRKHSAFLLRLWWPVDEGCIYAESLRKSDPEDPMTPAEWKVETIGMLRELLAQVEAYQPKAKCGHEECARYDDGACWH